MRRSIALFSAALFLFSGYVRAQELVTLDQVIALAMQKNYDVRVAQNIATAGTIDANNSIGLLLPQINAFGAAVWNTNHQEFEFDDETRNVSGDAESNNVTGSLQLVWTLFDGTKMFVTRERLSEIEAQGELNVKSQMVNSIASVINNYYNIVRQKQQLRATLEQMSVNEERVKLAERKLQVGTGGKPELLQAKVDLNAQRTLSIQQEILIAQLKDQLNGLVALQLPPAYDVSDSIVIDLNLKREVIAENIENRNYDLQFLQRDLRIGKLSLNEQRADRSPIINFNASYNYSKTNNTLLINPFSSLLSQTNGYNYGVSFSLPILNGLNVNRNVQLAKITLGRQQLLYEQQKQEVDIGIRNAYVAYDNAKKVLLIEEENILLARENVVIALESFKRGIATFIELRTAQQSLADGYNRLINARYLAKIQETELLRLNGGLLR
jgi:outer membrane protein TolC